MAKKKKRASKKKTVVSKHYRPPWYEYPQNTGYTTNRRFVQYNQRPIPPSPLSKTRWDYSNILALMLFSVVIAYILIGPKMKHKSVSDVNVCVPPLQTDEESTPFFQNILDGTIDTSRNCSEFVFIAGSSTGLRCEEEVEKWIDSIGTGTRVHNTYTLYEGYKKDIQKFLLGHRAYDDISVCVIFLNKTSDIANFKDIIGESRDPTFSIGSKRVHRIATLFLFVVPHLFVSDMACVQTRDIKKLAISKCASDECKSVLKRIPTFKKICN